MITRTFMWKMCFVGASIFFVTLSVGVSTAHAQIPLVKITNSGDNGVGSNDPLNKATDATGFQLVSCHPTVVKDANGVPSQTLANDCDYAQLVYTFQRIVNFALYLISPIVLVMIMYSGFKYITAGGDANIIADAKRMFRPLLIGVILILGAWLIIHTILDKLLADNVGSMSKSQILGPTTSN